MTATVVITPRGPFSLAASLRFLEGFTPAGYRDASDGRVLRLAFPADDGRSTVSAEVRQAQSPEGTVRANVTVHSGNPGNDAAGTASAESDATSRVRAQLARILSLDVDGSAFPRLAEDDPVVAELMAAYPGLRPVCFYSPYEAAAWAVIGHRIRMVQAAAIKARIAEHHGQRVTVAGESLHAFPTPLVLRGLSRVPGLPETKAARLRALADAALAGDLDAARLRAMPVDDALAHLRTLPGIGPFSAELILIRGAGHPDVFPRHERRLHASMAEAYGLGDPDASDARRLAGIGDHWAPYRSWVALLLRTRHEEKAGPAARHCSVR
ncbi:DNA-3-methyladenine glycosylase 2 family protein [Streptomyces lunaelactis]|uniref:DNA-3-methyladenine glycosylase family protein n=1 Tax=Streptomyces lunaelactis TaxID=1535768 RepID=UPI001585749B|nr:DNA-3-methyladenine glycosylase 2 family protein [Streptomyces lunaelactis]NUK33144.1 DNA-3-methyladenine glycosylase 2 family protein [Streptomyces lunaelactis]NUK40709.1 DNA-3-methyladenine glycosylase 2 family protein [Streptomyces lunaelactis]NUK93768.1 DNA-3-methyladenine glycosylase 2 family protein [Streptomyces lunaelactis]NUL29494.1 DNA-3-methyladenine glycosylase 2 family protein [Streptomyces lunaelactis]